MGQKVNPVNWYEIYVQDMGRARAFYEAVLAVGLEPMDVPEVEGMEFEMTAFPFHEGSENASGALVRAEGVPSGGNGTMVYFTCDDCAVEESRVEKAGGQILKSKFQIGPYGFCSVCMDTEGNTFGLHSMK